MLAVCSVVGESEAQDGRAGTDGGHGTDGGPQQR